MEALAAMVVFLYIGLLGFWLMGRLDRFIRRGGIAPHWDRDEAQRSALLADHTLRVKKDSSKVT